MELIRGLHNIRESHHGCVATIGVFDGLHQGHRMLLEDLAQKARDLSIPSVLVTFEPHPQEFLHPSEAPPRLSTLREKLYLLRGTGIDRVLVLRFGNRIRSVSARDAVKHFFVRRLGVRHLVVGDDFRFGRDAEGDHELLFNMGDELGFGVSRLETHGDGTARVSSSRVRQALKRGDLHRVQRLLGRPYSMVGRVSRGRGLGAKLGIPTANMRPGRMNSPLAGIFVVSVECSQGRFKGIASMGTRPTVQGSEMLLEVHLLDFQGDLYQSILTVSFLHKVREELRFDSLETLTARMRSDIQVAERWFAERGTLSS
ncbi:MAG: bifunctional riboflavin kinase/FAD synthetase [Pseudomonadales bacterium]|nr:bifunctional riboflavin kinase/FAD synthetase [Pseudomonadales bacterium]